MNKTATPVVVSEDGNRHEPLAQGDVMPVSAIPLSTSRQNLLGQDETGILLTGNDIVSPLEHNPVTVNVDGKLYFRANLMLSPDDKVIKVSDNLIQAQIDLLFDEKTSTLTLVGKDKTVIAEHVLPIISGVPTEMEVLQNYQPPKPAGFVENPYQKSTYLHIRYRAAGDKEVDTYVDLAKLLVTGGNGITVKDNVVSVDIVQNGGLKFGSSCCDSPTCSCECKTPLTVDYPVLIGNLIGDKEHVLAVNPDTDKLTATLRLAYDDKQRVISLLGVNDYSLGEVKLNLPDIPGLPVQAEFVDDPTGYPAGKYLYLQFRLENGTTKDLYLNVSPLVDIFSGGEGIKVTNKVIDIDHDKTLRIVDDQVGVFTPSIVGVDDPILSVSGNRITTTLGANFTNGTLYITGMYGAEVAKVDIPINDSARITSTDWLYNYTPAAGGDTGTYLRISYDNQSGLEDVLINFTPAIHIAGNGLELINNNEMAVNVPEDGPFKFTAKKELDVNYDNLVSRNEGQILIVSPVDGKLFVQDSGLSADKLADGLVVSKTTGNLELDLGKVIGGGLTIDPNSGKLVANASDLAGFGLAVSSATGRLVVKAADFTGTGLTVDATTNKMTLKLEDVVGSGLSVDKTTGKLTTALGEVTGFGLTTDNAGVLSVDSAGVIQPNTGLEVDAGGKIGINLDKLAELISDKIKAPVSGAPGNALVNSPVDGKPYLPSDLGSL